MFPITRREALKQAGIAGAGLVMAPITIRAQATPITVAGRPVEIASASVSRSTVRIVVRPGDAVGSSWQWRVDSWHLSWRLRVSS